MTKTILGFGVALLVSLYLVVDRYAGNDPHAATIMTAAAAFIALQTILLMAQRR